MNTDYIIREAQIPDALNVVILKIQVWLDTYVAKGLKSEYAEYLVS